MVYRQKKEKLYFQPVHTAELICKPRQFHTIEAAKLDRPKWTHDAQGQTLPGSIYRANGRSISTVPGKS